MNIFLREVIIAAILSKHTLECFTEVNKSFKCNAAPTKTYNVERLVLYLIAIREILFTTLHRREKF